MTPDPDETSRKAFEEFALLGQSDGARAQADACRLYRVFARYLSQPEAAAITVGMAKVEVGGDVAGFIVACEQVRRRWG